MADIRFPGNTDRLALVGTTGAGKTQAGVFHVSGRDYHIMPWIFYNWKEDQLINSIPHARHIGLDEVPDGPGIYVAHPMPHDDDAVEAQMWAIWQRGKTGVYIDEGYMVGRNNRAFRALLTQGRSKEIPMIVLSQRPVWMDKFVFTESDFYQVFRLKHSDDYRDVGKFVPADFSKKLPQYHSWYHDVGADTTVVLRPVPDSQSILDRFDRRLRHRKTTV